MSATVRLTVAQAVLRYLGAQHSVCDGKRQRLAKEIAFIAHPHATDLVPVDFHDGKRMAARLQNDDIPWLQFHVQLLDT